MGHRNERGKAWKAGAGGGNRENTKDRLSHLYRRNHDHHGPSEVLAQGAQMEGIILAAIYLFSSGFYENYQAAPSVFNLPKGLRSGRSQFNNEQLSQESACRHWCSCLGFVNFNGSGLQLVYLEICVCST